MLKGIQNRMIYMAAPTFFKEVQIIKRMPPVICFQPNLTSFSGSKGMLVKIV